MADHPTRTAVRDRLSVLVPVVTALRARRDRPAAGPPAAEDAYERIPAKVDSDRLRTLLQALDARERTIVSAHFGLDGPERSLRQVGATLGVSGERVRQVERVALESCERRPSPAPLTTPRPLHARPASTERPSTR